MDMGEHTVTKKKKTAEVLKVLSQPLMVRPVVLQVPSPLNWVNGWNR